MSIQEGICPRCIRELREKAEREGATLGLSTRVVRAKGFWGSLFSSPTKCLCTHCGGIYYEKD